MFDFGVNYNKKEEVFLLGSKAKLDNLDFCLALAHFCSQQGEFELFALI